MEFAKNAVLVKSTLPEQLTQGGTVKGYDFNSTLLKSTSEEDKETTKQGIPVDYEALLSSYKYIGFQATNFGRAIDEINRMLKWRLSDEPIDPEESEEYLDPEVRKNVKCKIFLGYTSNLVSSGLREIFRFLVQHKMVDCIVTTAGGIEEDFIKCLAPTFVGDFSLPGKLLRQNGLNRTGNLIVPNDNYCKFQEWLIPILDQMLKEQKEQGVVWTPSKLIKRLGKEINNPESIYYWAYKNDIPVFCPAITDGSLGDMLYFHSYSDPDAHLIVDVVGDIRAISNETVFAKKTGVIILGGGLIKHHICNANLMRNGADFAVYINTAAEYDGSDAGALPDEAVSWGKIRMDAKPVKIFGDATLIFPLLVSQTFAKFGTVDLTKIKKEQKDQKDAP